MKRRGPHVGLGSSAVIRAARGPRLLWALEADIQSLLRLDR